MLRSLLSLAIMCGLLFGPAGTLAWPQAWIFLALFNGCSAVLGLWLMRADPALLRERMRSPLSAEQKPRDRAIMGAIVGVFGLWLPLMALDARRFGWSHVSLAWQAIGAAMIVAAFLGVASVLRANSFASTRIAVQEDRGQVVVSTGPYAWVRHPMYGWVLLLMIGTPLLLGSLRGFAGLVAIAPLLDARARSEEALLIDGLPGYRAYAKKVRCRLVPGVW